MERWPNPPSGQGAHVIEFWDVDADYYPVGRFPEARPCHGVEEISQFLVGYFQAWSGNDVGIRELIAVGDDQVLVCATARAKGRESGVKLEGDVYHCVWLRHGRFYRWEDHLTLKVRCVRSGCKARRSRLPASEASSNGAQQPDQDVTARPVGDL